MQTTNNLADIITISHESAETDDSIRIIELSSLSDVIPVAEAETIRRRMYERKVSVRQLTNLSKMDAWTEVDGFVEWCMQVRHIAPEDLPIATEVLIFGDTVAFYRKDPEVRVTVVTDATIAEQQKALFDYIWERAESLELAADGSTG